MNKINSKTPIGKYLNIIVYIVFLSLFIATLLTYNIYMSSQIAKDTVAINLASRQSVLAEDMAKEVMNIDLMTSDIIRQSQEALTSQYTDGVISNHELIKTINDNVAKSDEINNAIDALRDSRNLFDKTLSAFATGGETISLTNEIISLNQVINNKGMESIKNSQEIWAPYLRLMDSFLNSLSRNEVNKEAIGFTVDYARIFNNQLLYEANDLVKALEAETHQKAKTLQLIQTIGIAVVILFFFMIVFGALRRLLKTDNELAQAREQTTQILDTIKEGLFLIGPDLVIAEQYSAQLETILARRDIAGLTLGKLLEQLVSKKNFQVTEDFIEQLFNEDVIEELIWELNPLDRISIASDKKSGERILSFNFTRVYDENEHIINVLVSVNDITRQVRLEERLEQEKQKSNHDSELLSSIINVPYENIHSFINYVKNSCQRINQILMRPEHSKNDLLNKANAIFREAHGLKGEASSINMRNFVSLAEKIEQEIKDIKENNEISGQDFTVIAVNLEAILQLNKQIETIFTRMNSQNIGRISDLLSQDKEALSVEHKKSQELQLKNFINELAQRNNKEVNFIIEGYERIAHLSQENQSKIREILIQLLRNAVVHGIESPAERQEQLKNRIGLVCCSISFDANSNLLLLVKDDGRGIPFDKLKEKARDEGLIDNFNDEAEIKKELLKYLFKSGISTETNVHEDAGQGVGMDLVKQRIVELRANVTISTKNNKGTIFRISIPT